jgi:hypothetical protein
MTNEPPQWALDKAAKAAGWGAYDNLLQESDDGRIDAIIESSILLSIQAHAATLAKYETAPVDPVLAKAREICKGHWPILFDAFGDESREIQAIMEALRWPAMGKSDAR